MELLTQGAMIGVVLGLLGVALWFLRRRGMLQMGEMLRFSVPGGRFRPARELHLLERLQLTPQHAVCMVRLQDRTLLIGTAPTACSLLLDAGRLSGADLSDEDTSGEEN